MKPLLALCLIAASAPALASDVTPFYRTPYAVERAGARPDAASSPFYRSGYAQPNRPPPAAEHAGRPAAAAARLAPPPKA